ncbi:MAG: cell wall hydrolase [Candidatus Metalachnospira sp.]|nr:cell wall hydrolase [Candidatus Metalachnospira sp.]
MSVYYWGSSGNKVAEIQKKLKDMKFYKDSVDGVFGLNTYYAVVNFQAANGLVSDGIVENITLNKLSITTNKTSQRDLDTLASVIFSKGRGEPFTGQVAIGAVILNRVANEDFPNTIEDIVYRDGVFDSVKDGQINLIPNETALQAAQDALNGWDPTGGALYFWNPATTTSKWIWSIPIKLQIGRYVFG